MIQSLQLVTFSYLSGSDLYHKIALLNRSTRSQLPQSGLVDQLRILTLKQEPDGLHRLKYAFQLAHVLHLVCTNTNIALVNRMAQLVDLRNFDAEK